MDFDFARGDSMRIVLIVAGVFALISFGILGYVVLPGLISHGLAGSGTGSLPTLEEREKIVGSINSDTQSAPVAQDVVAQRQKLLSNLNPEQKAKTNSATTANSASVKQGAPTPAPSPAQQQAADDATNAKLNVLNSLNSK